MTLAVWVLPSIDPAFRGECELTLDREIRRRLVVVDNHERNRGVAASWNIGIDAAVEVGADWLVILSESMRFGPTHGADFEAALAGAGGVVTAECDKTCEQVHHTGAGNCRNGYSWHLIALHMDLIRRVGRFDEIFWPAWWEDTDYRRRMTLAGEPRDEIHLVGIDAHLAATEHSIQAGLVPQDGWASTAPLYQAKWGGGPGCEQYTRPYGSPHLDWAFTGSFNRTRSPA